MKQYLGRKQTSRNADWLYAVAHIEELISRNEVEHFAADALSDIRAATAGKKAAYAYSAGKDSIVLADLCEKAGITTGFFAFCDLDYPAFIAWVRENKPAGVQMMHTGYGLDWLYHHQNLIFAEGLVGQRWPPEPWGMASGAHIMAEGASQLLARQGGSAAKGQRLTHARRHWTPTVGS